MLAKRANRLSYLTSKLEEYLISLVLWYQSLFYTESNKLQTLKNVYLVKNLLKLVLNVTISAYQNLSNLELQGYPQRMRL